MFTSNRRDRSRARTICALTLVIGAGVGGQAFAQTSTAKPTTTAKPAPAAPAASSKLYTDTNQYGNTLKHTAKPTTSAITVADLKTRLYIYSDDSMQGREFGTIGNFKATTYIAGQAKLLGLKPMGDSGTYFQKLPVIQRKYNSASTLTVDGTPLRFNTDFVPVPGMGAPRPIEKAQVIYGGVAGDTANEITPAQAAGKFVVLAAAPAPAGGRGRGGRGGGGGGGGGRGGLGGGGGAAARFPDAVGIATVDLDEVPLVSRGAINNPKALLDASRAGGIGARGGRGGAQAGAPPPPVVMIGNGGIGIVQNGQLARGTLPAGMTAAEATRVADSISLADTTVTARARADSLAAAQTALNTACGVDTTGAGAGARGGRAGGARGAGGGGGGAARGGGAGRGAGARSGAGAGGAGGGAPPEAPEASIRITKAAAVRLFGKGIDGLALGTTGKTVTAHLDFVQADRGDWGRNVVGMIPGSDPKLRSEYIIISGHNDHNGFQLPAFDHDSAKAFKDAIYARQIRNGTLCTATPEDIAAIHINVDSLHKIRPARMDSIQNGADDDGSGSVAVMEIAEYVSHMTVKPKRSILFIWHTGEEKGEYGSAWYAEHPTVPLDSIVTNINIDMIARGRAADVPGGGPTYLGVVGSGFLSKDLAKDVTTVNAAQKTPLDLDYRYDHPIAWNGYNNIYGRSDHFNYAKKCIPIVFFFTGLHMDYHQNTDEAQYVDFPHYALNTNYIKDLLIDVANADQRPSLDHPCTRQ